MIEVSRVRRPATPLRVVMVATALSLLTALLAVGTAGGARADTEVTLSQTTLGNVFVAGETPTVRVQTAATDVTWSVYDFWGNEVDCATHDVPGAGAALPLPVIKTTGFYELRVTADGGCGDAADSTSIGLLPTPSGPADDGFTYSVQAQFSKGWSTEIIPLMSKAGVEGVRDAQVWNQIETSKGTYDFQVDDGRFQDYMDRLKEAGIEPHVGLGLKHPAYDNGCTPESEEAQEAFGRFAQEVVNHYRGQVTAVGIYNEPNTKATNQRCGDQSEVSRHLGIARAVYDAVQDADYEAKVTAPELAEGTPKLDKALGWLQDYADGEGLESLDIASLHTYRPVNSPDGEPQPEGPEPEGLVRQQIAPVRDLLNDHSAGGTPIWITEMGWQSGTPDIGEANQARYLTRAHVLAMGAGVERFNWYYLMDSGPPPRTFGLVRGEDNDALGPYTPKPSYVAYAVMTSQLSGRSYDSRDDGTPAGVHSHRFTGTAEPLRVMWTEQGTHTFRLATDEPVRVADLMGRTRTLQPTGGEVRLAVSEDPQYVHGDIPLPTDG